MKRRLVLATLVLAATASSAATIPVLLASRRAGYIEAIDMETLETISRIREPGMVESVASDPRGDRLFIALPNKATPRICCALFALDLLSLRMTFMAEPAMRAVVTADRLFAQRGNVGIEVFDSHNLSRLPTIKAPGVYNLQPSPDGRWLFGANNFQNPSLDLFDVVQGAMVRHRSLGKDQSIQGAWVGQQYYLFSSDGEHRRLWPVSFDTEELPPALPVLLPSAPLGCERASEMVIGAPDRLILFWQFDGKLDGRRDCAGVLGGYAFLDPQTGAMTSRFAPTLHFRQMAASPDGRYLYGLDVGDAAWKQVRIVKLDARTGETIVAKSLDDDVWFMTTGVIPSELKGRLLLTANF
jgi:hypothetical protein